MDPHSAATAVPGAVPVLYKALPFLHPNKFFGILLLRVHFSAGSICRKMTKYQIAA